MDVGEIMIPGTSVCTLSYILWNNDNKRMQHFKNRFCD